MIGDVCGGELVVWSGSQIDVGRPKHVDGTKDFDEDVGLTRHRNTGTRTGMKHTPDKQTDGFGKIRFLQDPTRCLYQSAFISIDPTIMLRIPHRTF